MRTIVLYFSETGNCKRVAENIAHKTNSEIAQIKHYKFYGGSFKLLRSLYYTANWKKAIPAIRPRVVLKNYEHIIVITPVWASSVAPPVYSLLMSQKELLHKVCLIVHSHNNKAESVFKRIESRLGVLPMKFDITKHKRNHKQVIKDIVAKIQSVYNSDYINDGDLSSVL